VFCWLAVAAGLLILLAALPLTAALLPFLMLSTVWFLGKWKASDNGYSGNLETMIWLYLTNGTVSAASVVIAESILSYGFAILVFQSQVQEYLDEWTRQDTSRLGETKPYDIGNDETRKRMASQSQYYLFLALISQVAVALVEEGLKYGSLLLVRRFHAVVHEPEYVPYAMASALGFSTVENLAFIYLACQVETGWQLALSVSERVVGALGHTMMSCLLAIKVIRRDLRGDRLNLWHVIRLPVLLHGIFDFVLFCISAANGNIGWVHPKTGISLVLVVTLALGMPFASLGAVRHEIRKYNIRIAFEL